MSKPPVEHSWWDKVRLNWQTKRNLLSQISRLQEERTQLQADREHQDKLHQQQTALLQEENAHLREQLALYRDTLQTYQVEKQLQGAIALSELGRLGKQTPT